MTFMDRRDDFFNGNRTVFLTKFLTKLLNIVNPLAPSLAPCVFVGDDPGDGFAVAQDDDRLAAFDFVQQLREMRFGIGGLQPSCLAAPKGCGGLTKAITRHVAPFQLVNLTGQFKFSTVVKSAASVLSPRRDGAHDRVNREGVP